MVVMARICNSCTTRWQSTGWRTGLSYDLNIMSAPAWQLRLAGKQVGDRGIQNNERQEIA